MLGRSGQRFSADWDLPDGLVKDALEVSLGQGGTLEILVGLDLLGAGQRLLV